MRSATRRDIGHFALFQAKSPVFCGRGSRSARTPDFYCVILKSHFPLLPMVHFVRFC